MCVCFYKRVKEPRIHLRVTSNHNVNAVIVTDKDEAPMNRSVL